MSDSLTVENGRVVAFHYTLRDDAGTVIDKSQAEPLFYLHGHHNIVPGLERQLEGRSTGDELTAVVPAEEGYGIRREDASEAVHRNQFPPEMELAEGMPIRAQGPDGQGMVLWIETVDGDEITITSNHPLSGKTLHFEVAITEVRAATEPELEHGHVHGPGGHHH